jgi:predicted GTPase
LPTTASLTPYVLERESQQRAIILDSAGYGGLAHADAPAALQREWARVDVVLVVCTATQAARESDATHLAAMRAYFQMERRNQALPVIIAVVTHIDQLRPLQEWVPPYNIQQPDSPKAANIRLCCENIAADLQLPLHMIVPVCLAPDRPLYNIDDALLPLINEHLDAAQRVRYLRCLRGQQAAGSWRQWRQQMQNLGQLVLDGGK